MTEKTDRDLIREMAEAPDDWLPLKPFGFAPGNYMSKCNRCGFVVCGLDKRATSCRPCAEAARSRLAREDAQPAAVSACPVCRGVGSVGEPPIACPFCKLHAIRPAAQPAPEPAEPNTRPLWCADLDAAAGLLANCCDNLGDMPISEGWAERKSDEIRALLERTDYLRKLAAPIPPAKPLTEEQIDAVPFGSVEFARALPDICELTQPLRDFARAVIAEFCRINGIGSDGGTGV